MNKALWQPILGLVAMLLCAALILGGWFWYDASVDRSGWVERNGVTYYKDAKGHPVTGWQQIQGDTYFFLENNTCHKGFQEIQPVGIAVIVPGVPAIANGFILPVTGHKGV